MSGSTSRRLAGIASMTIDGVAVDVIGDLVYCPNTIKRETLVGQSGVQGYSEMPVAAYIAASIRDNGSLSVADLTAKTNSTIVVQAANGKSVYGSGLWYVESSEVKTQEGSLPVRFEGPEVVESTV